MKRERCRDLVGRTVRLTRDVTLFNGMTYRKGCKFVVDRTWRGRFTLAVPGNATRGGYDVPVIRNVRRSTFEVVDAAPPSAQPVL